jgi:hypothetical protein
VPVVNASRKLARELAMVAAIVEQPVDNVEGYIVIAPLADGTTAVASTRCCLHHALADAAILARAIPNVYPPCREADG